MYDVQALKRLISKEGVESVITYLTSDEVPESIKNCLTHQGIYVGGYVCLSAVYALAKSIGSIVAA